MRAKAKGRKKWQKKDRERTKKARRNYKKKVGGAKKGKGGFQLRSKWEKCTIDEKLQRAVARKGQKGQWGEKKRQKWRTRAVESVGER